MKREQEEFSVQLDGQPVHFKHGEEAEVVTDILRAFDLARLTVKTARRGVTVHNKEGRKLATFPFSRQDMRALEVESEPEVWA